MNESDEQFGNGIPLAAESLGVNSNPNTETNYKAAELRREKMGVENTQDGDGDLESGNGETLREANLGRQKNEARQKGLLMGSANIPGGGAIDMSKPFASAGGLSAFFLLPEMSQIGYFIASAKLSLGFAIPFWDGFWIWAMMFGKNKPRVGFNMVLIFWSLVFWVAVGVAVFVLVMVASFMMMNYVHKAQTIWELGFGALSAISSLF